MKNSKRFDVFRIRNLVEMIKERRMAAANLTRAAQARSKIELLLEEETDTDAN